jgi:hypothetical protein
MPTDQIRLRCYVDETGQDARSSQFIVVTVVIASDPEALRSILQAAESESGKRQRKWTKATVAQRLAYIERLLSAADLKGTIFFSRFPKSSVSSYPDITIQAIALALQAAAGQRSFRSDVYIDGLTMAERRRRIDQLRSLSPGVKKVRGMRDESDEFIRLADTFAGFIRAHFEGADYTEQLYKRGINRGVIVEVKA